MITIYPARTIHTMNPAVPTATAVAVTDGRVLAVGTDDEVAAWGRGTEVVVDDRFRDHVLVPGFVEAHSHVMAGGMWAFPYVGYFDRRASRP